MRRRRIIWQLFPAAVATITIVLVVTGWYTLRALRQVYYEQVSADLKARAHLVEQQLPVPLATGDRAEIDALCKRLGAESGTRITVILPSGEVLADSAEAPRTMDNHGDRAEVMAALGGEVGESTRYSFTLETHMKYVAIPLHEGEAIVGALRTSVPASGVDQALADVRKRIVAAGVVLALIAAIGSVIISRRFAHSVGELSEAAERFAGGDLEYRVPAQSTVECAQLADAMNEMAAQLGERVQALSRQRGEQEALLAGMVEGVLAVDEQERVISLNRAAGELFGVDPAEVRGRALPEVIRNPALQRLVTRALATEQVVEAEVVAHTNGERLLQAHGTHLRGVEGHANAVLIVLNDVTRLRRLEGLRREFVANVSHELRTPVTSIKGFVETLRDGALESPEDARRFLGILEKQADRLNAIIEDLLTLSRIEQEEEAGQIALEVAPLRPVLAAAIEDCQAKASAKGIAIELSCDEETCGKINAALLEQAVANLIDNAIKYSAADSQVYVAAAATDDEVVIRVRDQGCGIGEQHLPRLFERFYRVDKARSRKLGGTGLGLAIAKHITQAHGGRVTVESALDKGSTFGIHLPKA